MQLTSLGTRLTVIIALSLAVAFAMKSALAKPIPRTLVEVWKGGDDGLTNRLADALENAFKSSSDFQLSTGKKPGTLVVTIPENVGWKQVGTRTKVLYKVEFSWIDNQSAGSGTGSCWEDALEKCADRIVKEARTATRKTSVGKTL